ncbi:MAG: agmatine deiminase family protein [Coraliomargaritaceae bacterium]
MSHPSKIHFRFPADWERQEAVWFAWPTSEDLWPGVLSRVQSRLVELYQIAARYQRVSVLCPELAREDLLRHWGPSELPPNLKLFDYQTDDVWCRDFGPLFVLKGKNAELTVTDWDFNAWGGKFPRYRRDSEAPAFIAHALDLPRITFETILEGGAIESNGCGTVLTTEAVLLHPNRNGPTEKAAIESILSRGLGVEQVLWLQEGLVGDDTDGHIDNIARFFREDGVLLAAPQTLSDPNRMALEENRRRLQGAVLPDGRSLELVTLPLPDPIVQDGQPLAASYLNYLVLNGAVLVPTFAQEENDARALETLRACYPERTVIGFDCRDILREGGALHCLSQHQPA